MHTDPSHVLVHQEGGVRVLSFQLDEQGRAPLDPVRRYFASAFLDHTAGWHHLVIDLTGVATLDSSCLGPLVQKLRQVQEAQGRLVLAGVASPALEEIFALTRFDKVFPIVATRAEALALARAAG